MYRIGDFSKLGQVSVRMLRHYDKLGLLEPAHIDPFTGYRTYTIEQLPRLHRIVAYRDLGFSLQQIKELLGEEPAAERLRGMLTLRRSEIERELQSAQQQLAQVEARLHLIEQEGQPSPYEVAIKEAEGFTLASLRAQVPTVAEIAAYCLAMYTRLYENLAAVGIKPRYPEVTIYHNDEFVETDIDMEVALPVASRWLNEKPAAAHFEVHQLPPEPHVAALLYEGPYAGLERPILGLLNWVGLNGYQISGPMRELHRSGPAHEDGQVVDHAVIELQVPIVI